jgi:regulatory protein
MKSECKYSFLEAKTKLEALCAYQERCSYELNSKMISWGLYEDDRNALLADLITNNFLSEERFAEAFTSGKVRIKKWGRIKIRVELKQKQISDYSIKKAFNQIDDSIYIDNLNHLAERKWNALTSETNEYTRKMKVYRYLSSKGYETDLIKECVESIERD